MHQILKAIRRESDDIIQNWFTLLLLCTSGPLVLVIGSVCGDQFNCGSRQVKCELVDPATEDYEVSLCQLIKSHIYMLCIYRK